MKRHIVLAIISLIALPALGQKNALRTPKATWSIHAAGVLSNMSIQGTVNAASSTKFGFAAGVSVTVPLNEEFSLQPEATYARLGGKSSSTDYTVHANYLLIPVLAKFHLENSAFNVYAGPQYGLLLSAEEIDRGVKSDIKSSFNSGDFSLVGGAEFLPGMVGIAARYQLGLSNVSKEAGSGVSVRNNAISIGLVVRL